MDKQTQVENNMVRETKTASEIAHEIVNPEPVLVELSGSVHEDLVKITKYYKRNDITVRGERYWEKRKDEFISEVFSKLISDKAKQLEKQLEKQETAGKLEYVKLLRSKGLSLQDAAAQAGLEL